MSDSLSTGERRTALFQRLFAITAPETINRRSGDKPVAVYVSVGQAF